MKTALIAGICFLIGAYFGIAFTYRAVIRGTQNASLEAVAERAVKDVASAYESQINKSDLFIKLKDKIEECSKENSLLKKRIWKIENPRVTCPGGKQSCKTSL